MPDLTDFILIVGLVVYGSRTERARSLEVKVRSLSFVSRVTVSINALKMEQVRALI